MSLDQADIKEAEIVVRGKSICVTWSRRYPERKVTMNGISCCHPSCNAVFYDDLLADVIIRGIRALEEENGGR